MPLLSFYFNEASLDKTCGKGVDHVPHEPKYKILAYRHDTPACDLRGHISFQKKL
jgi:hypothetical protein